MFRLDGKWRLANLAKFSLAKLGLFVNTLVICLLHVRQYRQTADLPLTQATAQNNSRDQADNLWGSRNTRRGICQPKTTWTEHEQNTNRNIDWQCFRLLSLPRNLYAT
jgi:hypothetical protein